MVMLSWRPVLSVLLCLALVARAATSMERHVVLIALDAASYKDAAVFGKKVVSATLSVSVYVPHDVLLDEHLQYPHRMGVFHASPLPDSSISRADKTVEKVSAILEVLATEIALLGRKTRRRRLEEDGTGNTVVLFSVAFREGSLPVPTAVFAAAAFDRFEGPAAPDLLLLEKNKHLRSNSDWHDLQVLGMRLQQSTHEWLHTAREVYLRHADRPQFALLEPRLAIREASVRSRDLQIEYFGHREVCVSQGGNAAEEAQYHLRYGTTSHNKCAEGAQDEHLFEHHNRTLLSLRCSGTDVNVRESNCAVLHDPLRWRKDIALHIPRSWANHARYAADRVLVNPLLSIAAGVLRFRAQDTAQAAERVAAAKSGKENFPRQFCWSDKGMTEKHAKARIFYSTTNSSEFVHPILNADGGSDNSSDARPVIQMISATGATAQAIDDGKYIAIAKMYYCKRHGYSYKQMVSEQYVQFFPPNFYEKCPNKQFRPKPSRASSYYVNVMSKPVMIAEAMLQQAATLSSEGSDEVWMVWTDDDVYINPGWLYLPLHKTYLQGVPRSKLVVLSNYRSAFTNVIAIRNTMEGRALVYDWLSVMLSGKVECHAYDQAAFQILILLRLLSNSHAPLLAKPSPSGPYAMKGRVAQRSSVQMESINVTQVFKYNTDRPFNYTCLFSADGKQGCNEGMVWSCDFRFEEALSKAGFTTKKQQFYHNYIISSYSKGCANNYMPDFHVVTETVRRPRLQCGLCSRLDEILTVHHWDGPLGGGNDRHLRGAVNGWFFNHKSRVLFWKAYLDGDACSYLPESDFVPECDALETELHHDALYSVSEKEYGSMSADMKKQTDGRREALHRHGHNLVSLTDGYAFDISARSYCRVSHSSMLAHQKKATYMQDYASLVSRANDGYSEEQWRDRYTHMRGDESRFVCGRDDTDTDVPDSVLFKALSGDLQPGTTFSDYGYAPGSTKKTLRNCALGRGPDNMPKVPLTSWFGNYLPVDSDVFEAHDFCQRCNVRPAEWKQSDTSRYVTECKD